VERSDFRGSRFYSRKIYQLSFGDKQGIEYNFLCSQLSGFA